MPALKEIRALAEFLPPRFEDVRIRSLPVPKDLEVPVTELVVDTQDRQAVIEFFRTVYRASEDAKAQFEGNVSACQPGSPGTAFQLALMRRINFFRAMAGLPANIQLDEDLNRKCQLAALMVAAEFRTSHSPDPSWRCFSAAGAEAAAGSILHVGTMAQSTDIVDGFMEDSGEMNPAVGHRRWSFSSPSADFSGAIVTMTQEGKSLPIRIILKEQKGGVRVINIDALTVRIRAKSLGLRPSARQAGIHFYSSG